MDSTSLNDTTLTPEMLIDILDVADALFYILGINKDRRDDGYYLPTYQGFDYVGHILPLSLILSCDETKVSAWCCKKGLEKGAIW